MSLGGRFSGVIALGGIGTGGMIASGRRACCLCPTAGITGEPRLRLSTVVRVFRTFGVERFDDDGASVAPLGEYRFVQGEVPSTNGTNELRCGVTLVCSGISPIVMGPVTSISGYLSSELTLFLP